VIFFIYIKNDIIGITDILFYFSFLFIDGDKCSNSIYKTISGITTTSLIYLTINIATKMNKTLYYNVSYESKIDLSNLFIFTLVIVFLL